MCGFICGFSTLFHWSIFLLLCLYHTFLRTVALQYSLRSGKQIPPAPFFFLAIQGLLYFHTNCENFQFCCAKYHWQFERDCLESVNYFGQYSHFHNIDSSNPRTWYISPPVCAVLDFSCQYLTVSELMSFDSLGRLITRYSFCCSDKLYYFLNFFLIFCGQCIEKQEISVY